MEDEEWIQLKKVKMHLISKINRCESRDELGRMLNRMAINWIRSNLYHMD